MYERRLRILFVVLVTVTLVLVCRAMQLQVFQKGRWQEKAAESFRRVGYLDTTRGRILDYKGRVLAEDAACNDAAVLYPAIAKDPEWVRKVARGRLRARGARAKDPEQRKAQEAEEVKAVEADLDALWSELARVSGKSADEIEEIRSAVVRRVELRRKSVWYARHEAALKKYEHREPPPWYKRWLVDDAAGGPQADQLDVLVAEQETGHVILRAIDQRTYNELARDLGRFPGLELKRSYHRYYTQPANVSMAHLLGHLTAVTGEDLKADPDVKDELKRYFPNDLIGRTGLEAMAEPTLRGSLGKTEQGLDQKERTLADPTPGQDVRCTIDLELQSRVMKSFQRATLIEPLSPSRAPETAEELHGAAVVIDVASGEVRAMVSYPTFDANRLDADYAKLSINDIDKPLMNRAVAALVEPGSSVKTVVGSYGASKGFVGVNEGIECNGYLYLNGKRYGVGRCWVARMWERRGIDIRHHTIPVPHRGHDGNADGFLTLSDALQRSCNVYFETLADRMGMREVAAGMHLFGLGEKTGIGLGDEVAGTIPHGIERMYWKTTTWFAGIGQGQVRATPIQMANVAATLARDGIWFRPRLLTTAAAPPPAKKAAPAGDRGGLGRASSPGDPHDAEGEAEAVTAASRAGRAAGTEGDGRGDAHGNAFERFSFVPRSVDREDLRLSPAVLAAVKDGMIRVVNTRAGTGVQAHRKDLYVAAKTGSAQAPKFKIPLRDESGAIRRDAKGNVLRRTFEPDGKELVWYQGTGEDHLALAHAWYIGYAPADKPQVAFAVMVEYGGSGGHVAGNIARELLDACVDCGYLHPPSTPPPADGWIDEP